MTKHITKLLGLLAVLVAAPLSAQTWPLGHAPTAEGTVITNQVQVTFTDANSNSYDAVQASVQITVGPQMAIDVTGSSTLAPASPSTANNANFTVWNVGNGNDSVSVSITGTAGLTITGYKIGAATYATQALLNAALAGTSIASGGSVVVTVVYDVASAMGGETLPISFVATSRRDGTKSDNLTTNVSPPVFGGVSVTADDAPSQRLPTGSAAAYSTTFTVSNGANSSRTFTLTGGVTGAAVLGSVNGGTNTVTIAAGSSTTITVTFTVSSVSAGSAGTVTLTAAAQDDPTNVNDNDAHSLTVVRPSISLAKEAYRSNQTTIIGAADKVVPGETIWYKLTVTNGSTNSAAASSIVLTDQLPAQVTYVAQSSPGAYTYSLVGSTHTWTRSGTLAVGASEVIWISVTVK